MCERGKCVMGCVMVPQSVWHTECATASVLSGAGGSRGATRAQSSLRGGGNESTRADPLPRGGGKRPLPHSPVEQCGRTRRGGARGPGPTHRAGRPSGPLQCQARCCGTRPRPAPARSLEMDTRRPRPRAHTYTPGESWAHATHGARAPPPRWFEDPGQRLRGRPERRNGVDVARP